MGNHEVLSLGADGLGIESATGCSVAGVLDGDNVSRYGLVVAEALVL